MKRKFLVLACIAALVCSLLSACSLTQAKTITFAKQPQSVFVLNDTVNINDLLEVNVVLTDGSTRSDVPVTVDNFSTGKLGVFTATVSYRGASIQFTYYVVESLDGEFLGGDGTAENPYLIANAEQFMNIRWFDLLSLENGELIDMNDEVYSKRHFKLVADIDFGTMDAESLLTTMGRRGNGIITFTAGIFWDNNGEGYWNIFELDGDGHTIRGIPSDGENYYIFSEDVAAATVKNLNLEMDGSVSLFQGAGSVPDSLPQAELHEPVVLENVTVTGSKETDAEIQANLIETVNNGAEVIFKNCVNNAAMRTTSTYAAPFVGTVNSGAKVSFENCANNAIIEGQTAGAFVAQAYGDVTFAGCANSGSVFGTEAAGVIGSGSYSGEVEVGICRQQEPVGGLLAIDAQNQLYIDVSALPEGMGEVASLKVQMQFRIARYYEDSRWSRSELETVSKYYVLSDSDILTGFMNWNIYSKYGNTSSITDLYAQEHPGHSVTPASGQPDSDIYLNGDYCKIDVPTGTGGNYVTAEVGEETCYYFTDPQDNLPHYYVVYDGAWISYTVFAYDINGNLLFSSEPITTSQAAPV